MQLSSPALELLGESGGAVVLSQRVPADRRADWTRSSASSSRSQRLLGSHSQTLFLITLVIFAEKRLNQAAGARAGSLAGSGRSGCFSDDVGHVLPPL